MFQINTKLFCFLQIFFITNITVSVVGVSVEDKSKQFIGFTTTVVDTELDVFLGIPYAEPPIGDLRFRKPKPYQSEGKAINATQWPNVCFQTPDPFPSEIDRYNNKNISEDCLYLNIWSAKNSSSLKPVMFWIHGGALIMGSASQDIYSGEAIAALEDVVVVTINYRLQAMGFLYTGTDDAPGNVGLWDQALALQWVQNNIHNFGGDPKQVTIFGESAGGWSVSLHLLSPITRNLFKNAIIMSGTALNHVVGESPERALEIWLKVSKLAECGDGLKFTDKDIECLRKISAKKLTEIADRKDLVKDFMGFISTVRFSDQFLPKRAIEMLEERDFKSNVSLLTGFTDDEGTWMLTWNNPKSFSPSNPINLTKSEAINTLKNLSASIESKIEINVEDVSKVYMSRLPPNDSDLIRRTIGVALGDFYLSCPTKLFAKAIHRGDDRNNNVFQYYFTQSVKPRVTLAFCGEWQGACHGTDIAPAFGLPFRYPKDYSDIEKSISKRMINAFTHFAKYGKPPAQEGIDWMGYYTINGQTVQPYYEWTNEPNIGGNMNFGLKEVECEVLWKKYIQLQ